MASASEGSDCSSGSGRDRASNSDSGHKAWHSFSSLAICVYLCAHPYTDSDIDTHTHTYIDTDTEFVVATCARAGTGLGL